MTGAFGLRSRGAPSASNPSSTFTSLTTGNRSPIGCSRPMRPCSTSCMAAVPVTALVIDAMRNTEFERHRFGLVDRPSSERALIEDAAIVGGQRDEARNEARFDRLIEDFINDHGRLCWNLANCSIPLCQFPRAKRNQHGASIRPPLSHEPTYAMQQTIQNLPATEKLVSVTFPVSMSCFNLCRFADTSSAGNFPISARAARPILPNGAFITSRTSV